jgi:hypothetical protein
VAFSPRTRWCVQDRKFGSIKLLKTIPRTIGVLLLSACAPIPTYELVGCPTSDGWICEEYLKLAGEYQRVKACCPESARALMGYSEMKPDRCVYFSGFKYDK